MGESSRSEGLRASEGQRRKAKGKGNVRQEKKGRSSRGGTERAGERKDEEETRAGKKGQRFGFFGSREACIEERTWKDA